MDAMFSVHPNTKNRAGGLITLEQGYTFYTKTKDKINTKRLTKVDNVGVDDVMPQILWSQKFLKSQVIAPISSVKFQDNQSVIYI